MINNYLNAYFISRQVTSNIIEKKNKSITNNNNNNMADAHKKIRLAIIGTAGRSVSEKKILTKRHFEFAAACVVEYVHVVLKLEPINIILVSGGSAWMDHVAVYLYLSGNFGGLHLYLPAEYDSRLMCFVGTHEGKTLNGLHKEFNNKMGTNSFDDLTKIKVQSGNFDRNIKVEIKRGFMQRNSLIAENCDHLLAFTFAAKSELLSGGTGDTWGKTKNKNKTHFTLDPLLTNN